MDIARAAHIPAVNGYNPLVPAYGDANIKASPAQDSATFSTIDAAIDAAKAMSDQMDTAAAVFQAADGAYSLGLGMLVTEDGPEELLFDSKQATQMVFDDPKLQALVWLDAVARR